MKAEDNRFVLTNELKNGALLLSILTAIIYLSGISYRAGYLKSYGLSLSMFPYNFERTLVVGAGTLLLLLCILSLAFGILSSLIRLIKGFRRTRRWVQKIQDFFFSQVLEAFFYVQPRVIQLLFVLLLVFVVIASGSIQLGHMYAVNERKRWINDLKIGDPNSSGELVLVTYQHTSNNTTVQMVGGLIAFSDSYCGIYTEEGVIVIPKERIESAKLLQK